MQHQRFTKSDQKEWLQRSSSVPLQTSADTLAETPAWTLEESRFGHDFRQIPLHSAQAAVPQTQLKVSQPGDIYEQEADQVAERVMGMTVPEPSSADEAETSLVGRESEQGGTGAAAEQPGVSSAFGSGEGQPLDAATRAFMEPRFGYDFSKIRVHSDRLAAESAQNISALAYTVGQDVFLGEGAYAPETSEGKRLLAHELTHTLQQRATGALDQAEQKTSVLATPAPLVQRQEDPTTNAAPPNAGNLDQQYQHALQQARQTGNWQDAAEKLNGFNRTDIESRLALLTQDEIALLHQGALDNPGVGPYAQVAQMTAPGAPLASIQPVQASVPSDLDVAYLDAVRKGDWPTAAEKLNGFNSEDMANRLAQRTPEEIINLHQGALANPRVGPQSQVALATDPGLPMGGTYDDYKANPDYIDNFSSAAYDPFSKTLHLFFPDQGEAILPLPLQSGGGIQGLLVFERKSLLNSPKPCDLKIYPTLHLASVLPIIAQWLGDHATEMEQSDALAQAGTQVLQARSVPPDLWWLQLAAPLGGLGGRFLASRMRPSFATIQPEEGEIPVILAPSSKGGALPVPQRQMPSDQAPTPTSELPPPLNTAIPAEANASVVQPGSGYATSVGELKEPPVLQAIPNSRSVPPKFVGYDGFAGGETTETLTLEGKSGAKYTVVNQVVTDAEWISIISPETATEESVAKAVTVKLRSAFNAEENPSSKLPARDPDPIDANTYFRVIKDGPAKAVTIVINVSGPLSPEYMQTLQAAADRATAASGYAASLPNLTVRVMNEGE